MLWAPPCLSVCHGFSFWDRQRAWPAAIVAQECEPMGPIVEQEWDLNAQRGHSEHIVAQELRQMTVQE
jgi:hypothetical protein